MFSEVFPPTPFLLSLHATRADTERAHSVHLSSKCPEEQAQKEEQEEAEVERGVIVVDEKRLWVSSTCFSVYLV